MRRRVGLCVISSEADGVTEWKSFTRLDFEITDAGCIQTKQRWVLWLKFDAGAILLLSSGCSNRLVAK